MKRRLKDWRDEQHPPFLVPGDPAATELCRRLMGNFPPFVIEAPAEIDEVSPPQIAPVPEHDL